MSLGVSKKHVCTVRDTVARQLGDSPPNVLGCAILDPTDPPIGSRFEGKTTSEREEAHEEAAAREKINLHAANRRTQDGSAAQRLGVVRTHGIERAAGRQAKNTWARKGHMLTLADTIADAIAIERGCALLTDNRKDFPMPEVRLFSLP